MSAEQVNVLPHGVDPDEYHPDRVAPRVESFRRARGWDGFFVFLHVGSMIERKGVSVLLAALDTLVSTSSE